LIFEYLSGFGRNERISMRERSAPKAVRYGIWATLGEVTGEMMITPPGMVGVSSGMAVPEEMEAAIRRARRDLPQAWSPSNKVRPVRGMRCCQSHWVGWDVALDVDAILDADAVLDADARSAATVWVGDDVGVDVVTGMGVGARFWVGASASPPCGAGWDDSTVRRWFQAVSGSIRVLLYCWRSCWNVGPVEVSNGLVLGGCWVWVCAVVRVSVLVVMVFLSLRHHETVFGVNGMYLVVYGMVASMGRYMGEGCYYI
jgi:hypothetical protein